MKAIEKIIFNELASRRAVALPNVGVLSIARRAAQADGEEVKAPVNQVVFTEGSPAGVPTVTGIMTSLGLEATQAAPLYDEWLNASLTGDGVDIKGVGTLSHGVFAPSPELEQILNPGRATTCRTPVAIARVAPAEIVPATPATPAAPAMPAAHAATPVMPVEAPARPTATAPTAMPAQHMAPVAPTRPATTPAPARQTQQTQQTQQMQPPAPTRPTPVPRPQRGDNGNGNCLTNILLIIAVALLALLLLFMVLNYFSNRDNGGLNTHGTMPPAQSEWRDTIKQTDRPAAPEAATDPEQAPGPVTTAEPKRFHLIVASCADAASAEQEAERFRRNHPDLNVETVESGRGRVLVSVFQSDTSREAYNRYYLIAEQTDVWDMWVFERK